MINTDCHNNKDEKNHAASFKEQTLGKDQAKKNIKSDPRSPRTPSDNSIPIPSAITYLSPMRAVELCSDICARVPRKRVGMQRKPI
jgi:hypothetical protein